MSIEESHDKILDDFDDIDWEDSIDNSELPESVSIEVALNSSETPTAKKKRVKPADYCQQLEAAVNQHKYELQDMLKHATRLSKRCSDELIMTQMLSNLPSYLINRSSRISVNSKEYIFEVTSWFHANYKSFPSNDTTIQGFSGSISDELNIVAVSKEGTSHQLCQLFVSLLRALSVQTRLVCSLNPTPPTPSEFQKLTNGRRIKSVVDDFTSSSAASSSLPLFKNYNALPSLCWSEVYVQQLELNSTIDLSREVEEDYDEVQFISVVSSSASAEKISGERKGRWMHVGTDPNSIDSPSSVENMLSSSRRKVFPYVISIDNDGIVTDVSSRYCMRPEQSKRFRLRPQHWHWWTDLIAQYNEKIRASHPSLNIQQEMEEQHELQRLADFAMAPLPTTLSGFKAHPIYCLQRHVGSSQMLHPIDAKVVGTFGGECVYLRQHLCDLLTATQWKRRVRSVKLNETPVRRTVRKKDPSRMSMAPTMDNIEDDQVGLFGIWQTDTFIPPEVIDDTIPVNEYGNYEVWDYNSLLLPKGTVHIPGTAALSVARALGIPHASALVDFETRGDRRVPKIDGVVVLQCHAELVRDGADWVVDDKVHKQQTKIDEEISGKWGLLVRKLLTRLKLKETYGH